MPRPWRREAGPLPPPRRARRTERRRPRVVPVQFEVGHAASTRIKCDIDSRFLPGWPRNRKRERSYYCPSGLCCRCFFRCPRRFRIVLLRDGPAYRLQSRETAVFLDSCSRASSESRQRRLEPVTAKKISFKKFVPSVTLSLSKGPYSADLSSQYPALRDIDVSGRGASTLQNDPLHGPFRCAQHDRKKKNKSNRSRRLGISCHLLE